MKKVDPTLAHGNHPSWIVAPTGCSASLIPSTSLGRLLGVDALHFKLDRWADTGLLDEGVPFRAERFRTLALEVAEECPDGVPDVVALASPWTADAAALARGFEAWQTTCSATAVPRIIHVVKAGWISPQSDSKVRVTARQEEAARTLLVAEEGLSVSSDAASAFAGLVRELRAGRISQRSRIVVVLT